MEPIAATRAAERTVMRVLVSDLMVSLCMQADDPIAEADRRADINNSAIDNLAENGAPDPMFIHAALHQMETFWDGVRREVRARKTGAPIQPLPHKKDGEASA